MTIRDHICANVRLDIAKSGFSLVFKAAKKCWYDLFLKVVPWKSADDLLAVLYTQVFITFAHYIKAYTRVHQRHFRFFMFGNADGSMKGYGVPYQLQIFLRQS